MNRSDEVRRICHQAGAPVTELVSDGEMIHARFALASEAFIGGAALESAGFIVSRGTQDVEPDKWLCIQ